MTLSEELQWRGQIKDHTFKDIAWLNKPKTFYLGTDCSDDSLTIGNLAVYMLGRRLAKAGWKTVLLVGGATSLVGDPGGKLEERELKSREEIQQNVKGLVKQVSQLFDGQPFNVVDNYDWFKDIGYLEFLRDVGKHYSMSDLMQRDFVTDRMGEGGSGISYAEFSYSLIQGYDYWHLYKEHKVQLQIGGSDQWGNMLSGVPLIRKKEGVEVHALSMPLVINKTTGLKFGKSEAGAIWLDPAKTSIYQFYQFWLNVDDQGVADYLKIYTELDKPAIESILADFEQNKAARLAQKTLAYEVTKIVHGTDQAERNVKIVEALINNDVASLDHADIAVLREEMPAAKVRANSDIIQLLVQTGLATSNSEARRLLNSNAVYINGITSTADTLQAQNFQNNRLLLRRGKAYKDSALVELDESAILARDD